MEHTIEDVTITHELWERETRPPNSEIVLASLRRLADAMESEHSNAFQACVELALELCHADSCGISLRERNDNGEDIFRWVALAGQLGPHLHGTTPRYFSPCGICVDNNAPVLMRRPELVYKYLDIGLLLQDVLLIPLTGKSQDLEGTIWVVAHNLKRKFDREDARLMQCVAVFIASALNARLPSYSEHSESLQRVDALSRRERQLLIAIAAGKTNKQIATDLRLSIRTIEGHRARMMERLGVTQLAAAVRIAVVAKLAPQDNKGRALNMHLPA